MKFHLHYFAFFVSLISTASAGEPWSALVSPSNSLEFKFLQGETPVAHATVAGWGPNWQWVGVGANEKAKGDKLDLTTQFVVNKDRGEVIDIRFQVRKGGPRQIVFQYDLSAANDVPVTMLIAGLGPETDFTKGQWTLSHTDGRTSVVKLPVGVTARPAANKAVLAIEGVGDVAFAFEPPRALAFDGDMRVLLADKVFRAGKARTAITVTFPDDTSLLARQEDLDKLSRTLAGPDWFPLAMPDDLDSPSVMAMDDWLEQPAGKRGGVRMVGDRFQLEDGTPIKFWGTNLSYGSGCAPPKAEAEATAARFARYGVNAVRLHKFSYPKGRDNGIGDANDATLMDPEGLDRFDYFAAQLSRRGVYYAWSHTFGFIVCPGNRDRLVAYDEIEQNLKGKTYGFINFADDVQDLMIEMVVNLLKHKNPHTGMTYADDPALAFIELQNEDDIFFYTSETAFNACPTYKKLFTAKFTDWLKAKYRSDDALAKAWGGLKPGELLAAKNIVPQTNPWFFGSDHLPGQKAAARQRLLDAAAWLHELQNRFYTRFAKAIRDAGYRGPLCGSPWQAPAMLPHYLNLQSDAMVGFIDRHNYFGGQLTDTMLSQPGSGYLSSGLQQVVDRPFSVSEWIHVYPSLYSAEGPAIMAAYGLGLQGWDASFEFQSSPRRQAFNDRAGWQPWGVWDADVPTSLGQYPALARMIYRGDVEESEIIGTRRVSPDDLASGQFNFSDTVQQTGDIKSFGGSTPAEALAAGRCVVEFSDKEHASTFPDLARFRNGTAIVSATQQLRWETSGQGSSELGSSELGSSERGLSARGFFTIDTPGTKGVVGFASGRLQRLGNVTLELESPYASVILTALDKASTLDNAKRALLSVVARNCNTGFKYFSIDHRILDNGHGPILLEPVRATISSTRPIAAVHVLNHAGGRSGNTLEIRSGRFTVDG
ncbi:MAG TPA: hypothetical protein VFW87_12675, partial [Pirellulales bacterium]|nr:hypothetical protein [Pirellulales bacterium]